MANGCLQAVLARTGDLITDSSPAYKGASFASVTAQRMANADFRMVAQM